MAYEEPTGYSSAEVDANRQMLIDHYKSMPYQDAFLSWGYGDCAAGVLAIKGRIPNRYSDHEVAAALGLPWQQALELIYSPGGSVRPERVVWSLEALNVTGEFRWMNKPLGEVIG